MGGSTIAEPPRHFQHDDGAPGDPGGRDAGGYGRRARVRARCASPPLGSPRSHPPRGTARGGAPVAPAPPARRPPPPAPPPRVPQLRPFPTSHRAPPLLP